MFEAYYDEIEGKTVIARCVTFGCKNNRDLIRRLQGTCKSFHNMSVCDALNTLRVYERDGLVKRGDNFIVIYHKA